MRKLIQALACLLLVTSIGSLAWSSEADELRAKAKAVQREAEQAKKDGRAEEAEKLGRAVKELLHAAEKHDSESKDAARREAEKIQQQLKALAEKEQALKKDDNEEALEDLRKHQAALKRELGEIQKRHGGKEAHKPNEKQHKPSAKHIDKHSGKSPEGADDLPRRIKHIHVAIENLRAAGLHDVAEDLAKRAEAMQREHHEAHERAAKEAQARKLKHADDDHEAETPKQKQPPAADTEELRGEVKRLRTELNELREQLRKR